jgi:hypothetical protein
MMTRREVLFDLMTKKKVCVMKATISGERDELDLNTFLEIVGAILPLEETDYGYHCINDLIAFEALTDILS